MKLEKHLYVDKENGIWNIYIREACLEKYFGKIIEQSTFVLWKNYHFLFI